MAEVGEIQNVLLETGATVAYGGLQELRTNTGVLADGTGHLVDIGSGCFAEGRDGIDRGDTLGKESVGNEFGEFRGPKIGRQNFLTCHPSGIDGDEFFHGSLPLGGLLTTDQDAIRILKILDSRPLCQELRIGKNLEGPALGIGTQDREHRLCRFHGNGALLDDDLRPVGHFGDHARG